ncbi:4'-phosphopantetheinyl transferase A [Penicillium oxalicum]|nr:4'-phosphopantetheinyl transferase A [Penicillium oxalicum]KAI2787917.1 4'-phosphopantetheinyl transferase A [Penicillium oxalicum]
MTANQLGSAGTQSAMTGAKTEQPWHGLPTLVRWFISTRQWEARGLDLPLIDALRPAEQEAIRRYHFASDRRMSLASHLLKYLYIHRSCGVPWKQIVLSRTPKPEGRPYYASKTEIRVDFNVSHQASFTILAGVIVPSKEQLARQSAAQGVVASPPRIGIDITCVSERRKPMETMREYLNFISAFDSVFSPQEMAIMQNPLSTLRRARDLGLAEAFPLDDEATLINFGFRLFYSHWALKEAYLKMTGDALLADWLQELEFTNVIPPPMADRFAAQRPAGSDSGVDNCQNSSQQWGVPYTDIRIFKHGTEIHGVRLQLEAFEADYILAIAGQGCPVGPLSQLQLDDSLSHQKPATTTHATRIPINTRLALGQSDPWNPECGILDPWLPVQEVDIDLDVRACAEGRCSH